MYKVLIVEDMDITREDIMALIEWESYGFQLLPSARNGKIGLEYAIRYRPDIILTDIKMPVMDGIPDRTAPLPVFQRPHSLFGYLEDNALRRALAQISNYCHG